MEERADPVRGEAPLSADLDRGESTVLGHPIDGRAVDMQHVLHLSRGEEAPDPYSCGSLHLLHVIHVMKHYANDSGPKVTTTRSMPFRASRPMGRHTPAPAAGPRPMRVPDLR